MNLVLHHVYLNLKRKYYSQENERIFSFVLEYLGLVENVEEEKIEKKNVEYI
jgi:hypothetical protein